MFDKHMYKISALLTITNVAGRNMRRLGLLSVLMVYLVLLTMSSNGTYLLQIQ